MPTVRKRRLVLLIGVAAIAFVAKLLLALNTYGTNDVYTYERFGLWSRYFGADLYKIAPDLNHPPSMLHVLSALLWISDHTHLPFHFWLRFPGILADIGCLFLICRILGERMWERSTFIALLLIAIAPMHILISGFHGNTDPIMIFFVMAAVWLAGYQGRIAAGGVAYGLALCVKISPIILVPVLFLSLRDVKKQVRFFGLAIAVALIGWSPFLFQEPMVVIQHVFGYKSSYGLWGISWLLREIANAWPALGWLNDGYSRFGTPMVMLGILILSVLMNRMEKKPSLYTQVGMIFLFFFTATSGFAVQYLAWLTPWVAELGALPVGLFVVTGSVFLLVVYNYWNLGMPWYLAIAYPWSSHQYFQVLCWLSVVLLAIAAWRRIRYDRILPVIRMPLLLRVSAASLGFAAFLLYPAIVHMKRDRLNIAPVYGEDEALFTEADAYHNLAEELSHRGRTRESGDVQKQANLLLGRADQVSRNLSAAQPARWSLRTPEDYVEASLSDYNNGDFQQCISDARESLKLRPGMPAAWNNISLCEGELGNWDEAITAAREGLRIEPESEVVRENLDYAIAGRQRSQFRR